MKIQPFSEMHVEAQYDLSQVKHSELLNIPVTTKSVEPAHAITFLIPKGFRFPLKKSRIHLFFFHHSVNFVGIGLAYSPVQLWVKSVICLQENHDEFFISIVLCF